MFIPALRPAFISALALPFKLSLLVKALFSPATQFATGQLGGWYDPSDYATLFQDSAGTTPVTGVAQPVGRVLDKSGRSNTLTQATASARPLTNTQGAVKYLTFDGIDDGLTTGPMTFTADMDCFIAVRRNSAANVVLAMPASGALPFFGVMASADASPADNGSGTPTYAANGVSVNGGLTGTTRAQLHTALPVASWVVLEVRNLNLPAGWGSFALGNYGGGFNLNGDIAGIILCPAGDATARQKNRQYLGNKVGLTLP